MSSRGLMSLWMVLLALCLGQPMSCEPESGGPGEGADGQSDQGDDVDGGGTDGGGIDADSDSAGNGDTGGASDGEQDGDAGGVSDGAADSDGGGGSDSAGDPCPEVGVSCDWDADPEGCTSWKCYFADSKTTCRHDDLEIPAQGFNWTCEDDGSTTVCLAAELVTIADTAWTCQQSLDNETTTCSREAILPDASGGWVCTFPDGGGRVKTCDKAGGGSSTAFPVGNVAGYACAPDGRGVVGATVTISYTDCHGNAATATTDSDSLGWFLFTNLPPGTHSISVDKGPYGQSGTVEVEEGQTTSLPATEEGLCFADTAARIAVVTGDYDRVELVLDELGFSYDTINGRGEVWDGWNFLRDAEALSAYDMLFLNCGIHPEALFSAYGEQLAVIGQNLRAFIEAGGYVYASDWSYYFLETALPDAIDFRGEDINPYDVLVGQRGLSQATIVDDQLRGVLGIDTLIVDFDLPQWAIAVGAHPSATVYLTADARLGDNSIVEDIPVALRYAYGAGSVVYTSYHIHVGMAVDEVLAFLTFGFE